MAYLLHWDFEKCHLVHFILASWFQKSIYKGPWIKIYDIATLEICNLNYKIYTCVIFIHSRMF